MNQAYQAYVARLRAKWGAKFDESDLAPSFARYFGQRIEVQFTGEVKRGWVSGTTGWRPSLMLLLTRRSHGSSWLLNESDKLVRVIDRGPR